MADNEIAKELDAIKNILELLTNLSETARQRTLNYVLDHLDINLDKALVTHKEKPQDGASPVHEFDNKASNKLNDIRSLRDAKKPNSDVEMAALVAYYLSEIAPVEMRKDSISSDDISTYFKQANHPLPSQPRFTLTNARNAGYFESVGQGQYKLNPVGHNLVVHNMPRSDSDSLVKRKKPKTKNAGAKTQVAKKKPKKK